jgi:Protein of unknown function (DUF2934)
LSDRSPEMEKLPPEVSDRADAMDPELRRKIEERAYALWEADGRPEGRALDYWLQAEREIVSQSIAGEEDPLAGIDKDKSRHRQRQERSRG